MKFDDETSPDPLDDLLAQARWPKGSEESRWRLQVAWRDMTGAASRRWMIAWMTSAAAAVLAAVGTAWIVTRPAPQVVSVAVIEAPPAETHEVRVVGRPPTERELLLVRFAECRRNTSPRPDATDRPITRKVESPTELIRAARLSNDVAERRTILGKLLESSLSTYLEFVADRATRSDALAAARLATNPPMDALFDQLQSPRGDLRDAAANVLGEIDGPVVTRKLINLIAADRNRREAFLALASSRGTEAQSFLKQATESAELSSWARSAIAQTEIR